jgi:hypothetical protein
MIILVFVVVCQNPKNKNPLRFAPDGNMAQGIFGHTISEEVKCKVHFTPPVYIL